MGQRDRCILCTVTFKPVYEHPGFPSILEEIGTVLPPVPHGPLAAPGSNPRKIEFVILTARHIQEVERRLRDIPGVLDVFLLQDRLPLPHYLALPREKPQVVPQSILSWARAAESFLASASFEYAVQRLREAALKQRRDGLIGLKERLLTGQILRQTIS